MEDTQKAPDPATLPVPDVMNSFAAQIDTAQRQAFLETGERPASAAAPGKAVQVMEIDPAAPPEVQDRERQEAQRLGVPVVMKGSAKKEGADAHPLRRFLAGDDEGQFAMPEPTPEVLDYFQRAGIAKPEEVLRDLPKAQLRLGELSSKVEQYERELGKYKELSPDLQDYIDAELSGQDWREEARSGLDYNKPFSRNDLEKVVAKHSKIKLTKDDWAEYHDGDGDPRAKRYVESAIEEAKEEFERVRGDRTSRGRAKEQAMQEVQSKFKTSVARSLDLLEKIPGGAAHRERVGSKLNPRDIGLMFFESDGVTLKPDAAFNVWLLMDRDTVLDSRESRMGADARDTAERRLLLRQDERVQDRPRPGRGGGGNAVQVAQQEFNQLMHRR